MELILRHTFTHGARAAHAARDHFQEVVDVVGAAPLLVGDDVDLVLHLGLLDEFAVGAHAALRKGLGEGVGDQGGRVQAGQGDELPAVTQLGQPLDVGLLVLGRHGRLPVETRREVVRESGR